MPRVAPMSPRKKYTATPLPKPLLGCTFMPPGGRHEADLATSRRAYRVTRYAEAPLGQPQERGGGPDRLERPLDCYACWGRWRRALRPPPTRAPRRTARSVPAYR